MSLRLFFLIAFVHAACLVSSQVPFAPLGAKWTYQQYLCQVPNPIYEYFTVKVVSDSIIHGKYCTLVENINICPANASCNSNNYVYQEGSKVFIYEPNLDTFQMLYDFSLQAGKSYTYKLCGVYWGDSTVTISIDSADVGLEGFQFLSVTNNDPNCGWVISKIPILKGVGGLWNNPLLFPEICVFVEPCISTSLYCYETPSTGIVPFLNSCTVSSIIEAKIVVGHYFIYPNPAKEILTITNNDVFEGESVWLLFDQLGREVSRADIISGQNQVEVRMEAIPSGMYYWIIKEESRVLDDGKLIIQK